MRVIVFNERKKHNNKQIARSQIPYGHVYGVVNDAEHWNGWVKVGVASITGERLSSYQTADWDRGFHILEKVLVTDRFGVERELLEFFTEEGYEVKEEWVKVERELYVSVLRAIAETPRYNADSIMDEYRKWNEQQEAA